MFNYMKKLVEMLLRASFYLFSTIQLNKKLEEVYVNSQLQAIQLELFMVFQIEQISELVNAD